jgi:hypothetical protein
MDIDITVLYEERPSFLAFVSYIGSQNEQDRQRFFHMGRFPDFGYELDAILHGNLLVKDHLDLDRFSLLSGIKKRDDKQNRGKKADQ